MSFTSVGPSTFAHDPRLQSQPCAAPKTVTGCKCTLIPIHILKKIEGLSEEERTTLRAYRDTKLTVRQKQMLQDLHAYYELEDDEEVLGSSLTSDLAGSRKMHQNYLKNTTVNRTPLKFQDNSEQLVKVYDARHSSKLPGYLEKSHFLKRSKDPSVLRAYDVAKKTYQFYGMVLGRNSIDNKGMELSSTVHYGVKYVNAYFDGSRMVYGDGDGDGFGDFTLDDDIGGHEITHGVTAFSKANFDYENQSGALNESMSDVIGMMVKDWNPDPKKQKTIVESDWLIGEEVVLGPDSLRSMKAPGTAYNNPVIGKDDQPATMDAYEKLPNDDDHDNGGVHSNSGIPNKAFYEACLYLAKINANEHAWDRAGKIWYKTLTEGKVGPKTDFQGFANATIKIVLKDHGIDSDEHRAVMTGWRNTKVLT